MYANALTFTPDGVTELSDEEQADPRRLIAQAARRHGCVWLHLVDPDEEQMDAASGMLGLHRLAAEDAASGRQQPKVQQYPEHLFVVLFHLVSSDPAAGFGFTEVFLFVGEGWILTVEQTAGLGPTDFARAARDESDVDETVAIAIAYRILSDIIEGYGHAAGALEDQIEQLEVDVFDPETEEDVRRIYSLHQNIGRLDRAVSTLAASFESTRQHLQDLSADESDLGPFLRDLVDDAAGIAALTANQSRALDAIVSSHQSNVSLQQNTDMRTISALAALLAVPTVIAGLYGMNFTNLPLTDTGFGWAIVVAVVVLLDVYLYWRFKRRGWL